MSTALKARIVRIGNSQGVRIPKVWLDQLALGEEVELSVDAQQIVIRSSRKPRQGWDDALRAMAERGDDRLLDEPTTTRWERDEWQW
jgi:antitoxin MazE